MLRDTDRGHSIPRSPKPQRPHRQDCGARKAKPWRGLKLPSSCSTPQQVLGHKWTPESRPHMSEINKQLWCCKVEMISFECIQSLHTCPKIDFWNWTWRTKFIRDTRRSSSLLTSLTSVHPGNASDVTSVNGSVSAFLEEICVKSFSTYCHFGFGFSSNLYACWKHYILRKQWKWDLNVWKTGV